MPGLNQAQVFQSGNFSLTTALHRRQGEGVKMNSSTSEDVKTLCKAGRLKDALHILNLRGMSTDTNTYVCLLQECISIKGLAEGKQVHAHILLSGFKPSIFLLNSVVNMFAKCGSLVAARQVFDTMFERDVSSWTTMIAAYAKHGRSREAFKIYDDMIQEGVTPNRVTFICVLKACASQGTLEKGREVHAEIIKAGLAPYINLDNTLINMYAKCGSMEDARRVFDNMAEQDIVSWNAMIAGYAQHGCMKEAFGMHEEMMREGVAPDNVTFICILNVCASLAALEKGKAVHSDIVKAGLVSVVNLNNTLVHMYGKCGSVKDARQVFNNMAQRNVISWNAMIGGYAQHGYGRDAFEMYEQMIWEGVTPNKVTFICVLKACANLAALENGKAVHANIIQAGLGPDIILETALVDMYANCGSVKDARQAFENMAQRDVVSWSVMITAYAQHGFGWEAFEIYEQMVEEGVMPNKVTFICILNACASLAALDKGKAVHADIVKAGIALDIILGTALLDMYAKCGSMQDAHHVFDNMAQRDVVSWSAMIAGYAQHASGKEALEMYEQMKRGGVTPDNVTFICILNACTSLAALDKGKEVHADVVKAGIVSYINLDNTLIDMYAKCGSMTDAQEVFDNMFKQDVVSWSAMIAGYGQHGFGREALQLFEHMKQEGLKPNDITFVSLLSACSHAGLVEEGCHYFDSISEDHGLTPTEEHFGCMVDLLGRAGQLEEAEDFVNQMPIEPGALVWGALLGACRIHGDVERAERVAKCLVT